MKVGQLAWYMKDNKVHSAKIMAKATVENMPDAEKIASTPEQKKIYTPFGNAGVEYSTIHGIFPDDKVFESKEALLKSL